jgi:pimeloyl-ACP methyl ester carboxylesterase
MSGHVRAGQWWLLAGMALALSGAVPAAIPLPPAQPPATVTQKTAVVDGVTIAYKVAGTGPVVVLLHGYAQTSHMWLPLMPKLAETHTVIAPDLRGAGGSQRTPGGYDKKTMAAEIRALVRQLGHTQPVQVVGHDIGLMVAYAYAAQYPSEVSKIALMDAFLPGIGDWQSVWLMRDLWHFHFHGTTPEALVKGRERTYLEHFWNDFAADPAHSVSEADRQVYAAAYARDNGVRATFQYFSNFEQDAKDFAALAQAKLPMPMLVLTGEKASGQFLIDQGRMVATNVTGTVVKGSGHWLIDEAPEQVIPALLAFLRETPIAPGTSGVPGIVTKVLKGDPSLPGLYTIQLTVPAHTRIEAHQHPDDRVATVISGIWQFGVGHQFDERVLTSLPPGSFYREPPRERHFARTGDTPVVVQITGIGPSGTTY